MSTDLDLANQALGLIGQDTVRSLTTSLNDKAVVAINLQLDSVKEQALRARDWNCARRRKALAAATNESLGEWINAYRIPSDCLAVRRLISFLAPGSRHRFSVESDSQGKPILYCSIANAGIVYTANITDVNRWDRLLFNAASAMLAAKLASSFSRDIKLAEKFMADAFREFDEAVGVDEGEGMRESEISTSFLDVRNSSNEWWRPWRAS
jgi:hypothetical protein